VNGYAALAVLGQLVVKIFGVRRPPSQSRFRAPAGRLVEVWPAPSEPVAWPALWSLDEVDVGDVFPSTILPLVLIGHPVVMNGGGRRPRLTEHHARAMAAGRSPSDLLASGSPGVRSLSLSISRIKFALGTTTRERRAYSETRLRRYEPHACGSLAGTLSFQTLLEREWV
jgi:hypothetical protein